MHLAHLDRSSKLQAYGGLKGVLAREGYPGNALSDGHCQMVKLLWFDSQSLAVASLAVEHYARLAHLRLRTS